MHAREDERNHNAKNKVVPPTRFVTMYYIERQDHELYNLVIFIKFQHILKDVTRLHLREHSKENIYVLFQVSNYPVKEHMQRNYIVQVNLQKNITMYAANSKKIASCVLIF